MALKRNMSKVDIKVFIEDELVSQVEQEVQNWVFPFKKRGGYFVTVRQILCMVDFLGATNSGYTRLQEKRNPLGRNIATSGKAIKFILTYFQPRETYDLETVTWLYSMYRHGLVHLYQPKILKLSSSKTLKWFFYRGKRKRTNITVDSPSGRVVFRNVDHLKIVRSDKTKKSFHLAICIDAFYDDFMDAVLRYRDDILNKKVLQKKWRMTVNAICKPRTLPRKSLI